MRGHARSNHASLLTVAEAIVGVGLQVWARLPSPPIWRFPPSTHILSTGPVFSPKSGIEHPHDAARGVIPLVRGPIPRTAAGHSSSGPRTKSHPASDRGPSLRDMVQSSSPCAVHDVLPARLIPVHQIADLRDLMDHAWCQRGAR
jgi:hypothetical protein